MTIDRIRALLDRAPVLDGHNDLPWALRTRSQYAASRSGPESLDRIDGVHTDLARLGEGGVGGQFWSVFVSHRLGDAAVAATLEQIDFVHRMVAARPDRLTLATTSDEVEAAHRSGRIASLIGMEGGHSIAGSLGALRMMYALGARYMTLTHVRNTPWADSATDVPAVGGLTAFGRDVVREMNRLGMLVDLSHVAPATMHAALDTSTAPAFFSHSSARALCDHPRNVPDDVLVRVRDSGGVVMVTFVPSFLTEPCRAWMDGLKAEEEGLAAAYPEDSTDYRRALAALVAANPGPPCGIGDVADHIEHVRAVAGVGAVGIGGDFDGVVTTADGLPDVSSYPALLAELAERGWSDPELAQLTWGNPLRVLRDTEAAARSPRP